MYSLRHTYATELLEETGNIVLVAEQLGNDAVVLNEFYNKARATTKASAFVGLTQQAKYKGSKNKEKEEVIKELERLLKQLKT